MEKTQIDTVEQYIHSFPLDIQEILNRLRKLSLSCSKDLIEKMSYQMPTYHLKKNMIHFAAFTNHIGIYPGPKAIVVFKDQLKAYKCGKGSIQIPLNKPFPYDLYKDLLLYNINN
ncbi:MAG: DUF1801 domain-containing protein [Acholeplasmataceae bacterium]|nr:DUF1801 domain-containing protein [Acholeplasmataceae bacterium]